MATTQRYAIGLVALAVGVLGRPGAAAAGLVELRESAREGTTTRVKVGLKAQGKYLPAPPPGAAKGGEPKALALRVEAELEYAERVVKVDGRGRPGRAVRRVFRAASAINGEVRPQSAAIRPSVAILVAEPKAGGVVVFSPGGPLTRPELELVQGPGDPLALEGLLPGKPVEAGDRWPVGDSAARSLSAYDTLESNKLQASLESVEGDLATVRVRGDVRGSVLGGEGTMACDGSYTFDRKAGRVDSLTLSRAESRRPGPVEEGLDVKSTLTVTRRPAEAPAELSDRALEGLALEPRPETERLLLVAPDGRFTLVHDRDWHTYWDDPRLTVLKRLDRGKLVAQCNLAAGPRAGKGRHQDPAQFRDDVRKGLGTRFEEFLGAGELAGDPGDGFRYKVGVKGRQGDLGVVWYYYLIASPEGEQLLGTFTLTEAQAPAFGDQDEALIGSLRWREPKAGEAAAR